MVSIGKQGGDSSNDVIYGRWRKVNDYELNVGRSTTVDDNDKFAAEAKKALKQLRSENEYFGNLVHGGSKKEKTSASKSPESKPESPKHIKKKPKLMEMS